MQLDQIVGTWQLKQISDIHSNGVRKPRDYKTIGKLVYTPSNEVFLAMGYLKPSGYESNFYSGKFSVNFDSSKIQHTVEISSNKERIGKVLERTFRFSENQLVITGKNEAGNEVELVWQSN